MNKFPSVLTFLLIVLAIYWSFRSMMPSYSKDLNADATTFSVDRAMEHIEKIGVQPHGVGFPGHAKTRDYIVSELNALGLETSIQQGYTAGDWANFSKASNILARIKGTASSGKALLLLSHYDSSPHSSLGASDAGSGVATILESVRAFLATKEASKNDIIILITDAEELGLNGADLFVNNHPWAKEIGLVLNFEARGSGGPSYMLIETNRGNGKLISEFTKAHPKYPVANSLAYSIYKMLPNDTDLTVFREDGDIEGFNFAFIDDHFDYHTVRDNPSRLDRKTLKHQGSYLMPLLMHFAQADLSNLKSLNDYIYFNVPFFKLVSYPFEWIWPMFGLSLLLFIGLLIYGFRKKSLTLKGVGMGFLPVLIILLINGLVGYYGWTLLKMLYPQYQDMLHGFTYNGHAYIAAFTLFSIAVCFWAYHKFRETSIPDLLVAPLVIWLLICGLVAQQLPGASFFIIPVFAFLGMFLININQKYPSAYLMVFMALPTLFIFAPFVKMFPVGLGLKLIIASTLFTSLIFLLLLPILGRYRRKIRWIMLATFCFFICVISAHFNSGFSEKNAKPSSLLYVLNTDDKTAHWATYDQVLIDWNKQFINQEKIDADPVSSNTISSKYGTGFTHIAKAPLKNIQAPLVEKIKDTIVGNTRTLEVQITHQREVKRLELYTTSTIKTAHINGIPLSSYYLENRTRTKLLTHYISNNESTKLTLSLSPDEPFELTLYEASNDLLNNQNFSVPQRPKNSIPMPFVLNDAILVTKTVQF